VNAPHAPEHIAGSGAALAGGSDSLYRLVPYVAFLLAVVAELVAIGFVNHGSLTYTLDDAYIHLALAERISAGTYGINVGEFAAPASSILWPFLLSPFARSGFLVLVPCALNLAAALGTLIVMARVTRWALETESPWSAAFVTLLILATSLVPLAFTGMEHSLQQLLAVLIVAGLIDESKSGRVPTYVWAALVLVPLVRYDSLALSVPALIYLAWRGHWRGAVIATLSLCTILGAFSWYLKSHGLGYLPTSVTAKADVLRGAGSIRAMLRNLYINVVFSPQGNILLLGCMLLVTATLNGARAVHERGLALTIAAALLLHLTFGRVGAYFRYETYLSAATLLTLIYLHRDWLRAALRRSSTISTRVAALGSLAALSIGYVFALMSTPLAANNIYDQQYQMHRFVVDYYKGPVAVNDLGWVAFHNPYYVLDFWGLGSAEAQQARMSQPSGDWMDRLCREHDVGLIMIFEDWFPNRPAEWIRLGSLKLLRAKITPSDSEVQFYARDSASAARARSALAAFSRSLPEGAEFVMLDEQRKDPRRP
jgi:hypothetical protein